MTPSPSLQELIQAVRTDAPGLDPLDLLACAAAMVGELEDVGDALLGHFVDQCRGAGQSWAEISRALGVSRQAAHKRFTGPGSAPNWERFTPRARLVLEGAADEAQDLGHGWVGTEHLLLGLFRQPEGLAARALSEVGITAEACRGKVTDLISRGDAPGPFGTRPFTPRAIEVLRGSVEEALLLGHNYIGTEHLLLALYRDANSVAARVLAELNVARDDMAARLVAMVTEAAGAKSSQATDQKD